MKKEQLINGANYLITTDDWFIAPDGQQYRAVWGPTKILEDSFLGITTNRNSSNWYVLVGSKDKHVIIAGCQIHFAVRKDDGVHAGKVEEFTREHGIQTRPTLIYVP